MRKRGMSHVEMIISFVLFVVAIGFALYFLSPFNSNRLAGSSLSWTFREISENASVLVHTFPVSIDNSGEIGNVLGVEISNIDLGNVKSRVEDSGGSVLASDVSGTNVFIRNPGWNENDFITIKLSEDFDNPDDGLSGTVNEEYYEIASSSSKELISEKRIISLRERYLLDYAGLKESFNLPNRVDFAFGLRFKEGDEITAQKDIANGAEVFSEIRRKKILRNNGEIEFADLTVKVW